MTTIVALYPHPRHETMAAMVTLPADHRCVEFHVHWSASTAEPWINPLTSNWHAEPLASGRVELWSDDPEAPENGQQFATAKAAITWLLEVHGFDGVPARKAAIGHRVGVDEANAAYAEHAAEVRGEDHKSVDCRTCEDLGDLYAQAVAADAAANYGQSPE